MGLSSKSSAWVTKLALDKINIHDYAKFRGLYNFFTLGEVWDANATYGRPNYDKYEGLYNDSEITSHQ